MKKIIFLSVLTLVISTILPMNLRANESTVTNGESVISSNSHYSKYSKLVIPPRIKVDFLDEEIELYVEYESIDEALRNFYLEHREVFDTLQDKLNLEELSKSTAPIYFDEFLGSLDTFNKNIDSSIEVEFYSFFDLLDGSLRNDEIIKNVAWINQSIANQTNSEERLPEDQNIFLAKSGGLVSEDNLNLVSDLALIIPTYNSLFEDFNMEVMNNLVSLQDIDKIEGEISAYGLSGTAKDKAIAYAAKYATGSNSSYTKFSADCTNFASQILEAAGVKQESYASEHSGWWHKVSKSYYPYPPGYIYYHTHSVSWIRADTFTRYMGIGKKAYNVRQLGDMVVAGDFLAIDRTGNGSWDHVGFVTAVDSYYGTYGDGKGKSYYYKDFKIAQHTIDYNLYTSNNGSNWETFGSNQVVALVRR